MKIEYPKKCFERSAQIEGDSIDSDGLPSAAYGSNPNKEALEEQLQALWQKGKIAWADVPTATDWVEEMRGERVDQ